MNEWEDFVKNLNVRCGDSTSVGGQLVSVIVPAGTFTACKVTREEETQYIGNIPFFIIKKESSDGTCEAVSFTKH